MVLNVHSFNHKVFRDGEKGDFHAVPELRRGYGGRMGWGVGWGGGGDYIPIATLSPPE